jgi:hypothetical protein
VVDIEVEEDLAGGGLHGRRAGMVNFVSSRGASSERGREMIGAKVQGLGKLGIRRNLLRCLMQRSGSGAG